LILVVEDQKKTKLSSNNTQQRRNDFISSFSLFYKGDETSTCNEKQNNWILVAVPEAMPAYVATFVARVGG